MDNKKLVIVGSGPAGYSAAIYAARAQLEPVVIAGEKSGGQLMLTTEVENYAGFPEGVMGPELMINMRTQAEKFGAVMVDKFAKSVRSENGMVKVEVGDKTYESEAVILATGAVAKMLNISGEEKYLGRGVAVCAVCDAAFYKNKKAIVVGGGDAAMEDVLALTKFASEVILLVRRDVLRASRIMQDRVLKHPKVSVIWNTSALEVVGDEKKVTGVRVKNNKTEEEQEIETDGFFLSIGHTPATKFLDNSGVMLNEKGYVVTRMGLDKLSLNLANENVNDSGLLESPTMTSVEGVFAAGDNVDFRYRQAITAAAMGTMAALDVEWWLERKN